MADSRTTGDTSICDQHVHRKEENPEGKGLEPTEFEDNTNNELKSELKDLFINSALQDVIFIASRRILRPPKKGSAVTRPRNRTLTAVHDAVLEDVVYPAEIILLDPKEKNNTEYKVDTFVPSTASSPARCRV
ncbi:unnamed protein product [Spirodela intermedia]|uniref:40S ribosomal protein S7 n=1 Tax=Spirodela intermedia TaxID=51605 RepID=A0ABN7ECQ4_SPIIN|nr:unnamed protein product [Spirodela intermedia]